MRLKLLALAAAMAALTSGAHAAPSLQSCAAMEITHSGEAGLSYRMSCLAGGWQLQYTGAVPAGTKPVTVQYRVAVSGSDGSAFTMNRTVRVPAPAQLGQMLTREAVLLDNGQLALRECKEIGCTKYRPLGGGKGLASATVTVTPELKRLQAEHARLTAELDTRTAELAAQREAGARLSDALVDAQARLVEAESRLQGVYAEFTQKFSGQAVEHDQMMQAAEQAFSDLAVQTMQLSSELLAQEAAHKLKQLETCATEDKAASTAALAVSEEGVEALKSQVSTLMQARSDRDTRIAELEAETLQLRAQLERILATAKPMSDAERDAADNVIARLRAERSWLEDDLAAAQAEIAALKAQLAQPSKP